MKHKIKLDIGFGMRSLLVDDVVFMRLVRIAWDAHNDNGVAPGGGPGMAHPFGFDEDDE